MTKSELDKKIHDIIMEKRALYIKEDKHQISQKEYEKESKRIEEEWRALNKLKIEEIKQQMIEREKEIEKKQEKVIENLKKILPRKKRVVKSKPIVVVKKNKKKKIQRLDGSYAALILKALKHPKANTEAKVIAIVNEWKPGAHPADLSKYIKNIIAEIKRGKQQRYKGYTWDEKIYQVKTTCQTTL